MVSVEEARSEIKTQREALESQRQQIRRTELPKPTALQLRQRTRGGLVQRDIRSQQLETQKKQALQTLVPISKQLEEAEKQIAIVEKQLSVQAQRQSDFEQAKKLFKSGKFDPFAPQSIKKFIRGFEAGRELQLKADIDKAVKDIEVKGLKAIPFFEKGKLIGFKAIEKDKDIKRDFIFKPKEVKDLGGVFLKESEIPKPKPSEVRVAEGFGFKGNINQLVRNVKEEIPELKFVKNQDLRKLLQKTIVSTGIPAFLGTSKFAKSELKQALANPTGAFKFRVDQSEAIGNLVSEVVENVLLGKGTGKILTLTRGAGAKLLPKALTGSSKFGKLKDISGKVGGIVLTGAAGLSIAKTFKEEGEDAAILQTIGFISFGSGFTTTGLKSTGQAKKEIEDITNLLKNVIPKGKKGQARFDEIGTFFKKKKKSGFDSKDPFAELEQIDRVAEQQAKEVLAAIERRLAQTKNPKEQLKFLSEIKNRLKTPQEKDNFKIFVKGLIEKDILKVPKIEIVPGVKTPFQPKGIFVKVPKRKSPGRIKEEARTKRNQARNQKRIEQSRKPLSERIKIGSAFALAPGLSSAKRIKQRQQLRQKSIQKTRTAQRNVIAQKNIQITKQRQVSKQKLKNLLKNSLIFARPKKIIKPFRPFGFPIIPLGKVKKKVKILPFKLKGKSFNVKVRKKGVFIKVAKNLQENRAKKFLAKRLDNTLRASGRIVPSKKPPKFKKDIKKFDFNSEFFRLPKKNSKLIKPNTFTLIEKKGKRLSTKSEVNRIQQLRIK